MFFRASLSGNFSEKIVPRRLDSGLQAFPPIGGQLAARQFLSATLEEYAERGQNVGCTEEAILGCRSFGAVQRPDLRIARHEAGRAVFHRAGEHGAGFDVGRAIRFKTLADGYIVEFHAN